jgi:hypothetical protein
MTLSSQAALLALASHASDPAEAERLRFLASPAGKVFIIFESLCYAALSGFFSFAD